MQTQILNIVFYLLKQNVAGRKARQVTYSSWRTVSYFFQKSIKSNPLFSHIYARTASLGLKNKISEETACYVGMV